MTQNATGVTLYSKVVSAGLKFSSDTPSNTNLWKLKQSLKHLLAKHPEGISLSKARRSCPLLLEPEILKEHASVRQLLKSMSDVVMLQGCGVQTILLPISSRTPQNGSGQ